MHIDVRRDGGEGRGKSHTRPQLEKLRDLYWACALSSTKTHVRKADGSGRVKQEGPLGALRSGADRMTFSGGGCIRWTPPGGQPQRIGGTTWNGRASVLVDEGGRRPGDEWEEDDGE